jgi:adenylosuccinate synthase
VNPKCTGVIGSGVVVHVPSFFAELDALESQGLSVLIFLCHRADGRKGLDCSNRLFISDRAHLVFDFHQIVDGLKEVELGGSRYAIASFPSPAIDSIDCSIGTTKKGIGPAYSGKASRSGLRVHHLFDDTFAEKFRKLVEGRFKRYGHFEYDTEGEIIRYKVCFPLRRSLLELI